MNTHFFIPFLSAIAEVFKNEGNDEYGKRDFTNAVYFYTEGIKVKCKGDELNAKLHSNRAIAHFYLGETIFFNLLPLNLASGMQSASQDDSHLINSG